jgi:hypothetical protein
MVKRYQQILVLATALLGGSCSEEFTPKTVFKERLVLYSVVSASDFGTASPSVLLTRSYDVDGLDPSVNTYDPAVRGATVDFTVRRVVTRLTERSIMREDSSRYTGPQWYYGAGSIPLRAGDTVSVSARLADGRSVSAWTIVPTHKAIETFPLFPRGFTTLFDPFYFGTELRIDWHGEESEQHLFFPRLIIQYQRWNDSSFDASSFEIPIRYIDRDGGRVAVYPRYISRSEISYEFAVIDEAVAGISNGDPDKSRYRITGVSFSLAEYDFPLSRYYASVNGYLDQYSVRLDEAVYTNVSGGIGVLGSTYGFTLDLGIDSRYARSFGYNEL